MLWPFVAVWRLVTFVLVLTGRLLCAILGLLIMAIGVAVTLSVVGAPLGVPLAVFGVLLVIRALF
ncbi:MAG: hypothetical protein AAF417_06010 [Pseudomonadota bacterium]